MKGIKANSPFLITPQKIPHKNMPEDQFSAEDWLEGIKHQARDNLDNFWERARIEWSARFKTPKYDRFEEYSRDELLCELWEQYYLENPDNIELKGINKKKDSRTGYTYYVTGDPVIDELERSFAAGIVPDMNKAFSYTETGDAKRIWEEPIFETNDGEKVNASGRFDHLKKTADGKLTTPMGTSVHRTDFASDDWLNDALNDDPVLKAMKEKLGV